MDYMLIKVDEERFFRENLDPDAFEAQLKHFIGDAKLEPIVVCVGGTEYHFFVSTNEPALRPKLMCVKGVAEVLSFTTKPFPG